jgi:RecA-family ATPase
MATFEKHRGFLDSFGKCIYSSRTQSTLKDVAKWIEDKAKTCRIIAVDPVTIATHKGEAIWKEDDEFLDMVKRVAVKNECSVILVTHPVKGVSNPDVNQLAGGAAYQRFAHSILWLESHKAKTGRVKMACGTTEAEYNRTLHILKARNGRGLYKKIACEFQSDRLRLKEIGFISRNQE